MCIKKEQDDILFDLFDLIYQRNLKPSKVQSLNVLFVNLQASGKMAYQYTWQRNTVELSN